MSLLAMIGFILAGYSVIANDSVQTLGTWISSNKDRFNWKTLWLSASLVLTATLVYGWWSYGGDISFGRLEKIPFQEIKWWHALAPLALLYLTRKGIPVSTSFLVLSTFASTFILEKMLVKSMLGYGVAAIASYLIWFIISKFINERKDAIRDESKPFWRWLQWGSTGFLWYTWLSHDLANIAVYLPRELSLFQLIVVIGFFVTGLAWIFYKRGGKIQDIVMSKKNTKFVRSATIIDLVYAFLLLYFKEMNSIPMSTTWVFVGLLCGRELALHSYRDGSLIENVFPIVSKDFLKLLIGLGVSVVIVLGIHYFIK